MKWLRNLLKGASLTGALFAFQACFGVRYSPFDDGGEAPMSFTVVSHRSGDPIAGIRVFGEAYKNGYSKELGVSGDNGRCSVRIPYVPKDTTLADLRQRNIVIKMDEGR